MSAKLQMSKPFRIQKAGAKSNFLLFDPQTTIKQKVFLGLIFIEIEVLLLIDL